MRHLFKKLSAFLVMLMCMSATVQAAIVHHEVCQPTQSSRGFTRECWENTETGKIYSDANCTQELVDEALAKAVVYAKLQASPITYLTEFHESEHENDWSVDFNWAAVTTFESVGEHFYQFDRFAKFTVTADEISNARLVWNRSYGSANHGKFTVEIYVNNSLIYSIDQNDGKTVEGVFVQVLPGLKPGDEVYFYVRMNQRAIFNGDPTFKACLEYVGHTHTYSDGWCVCSCGYIKDHSHRYENNTCTLCGLIHHDVAAPTIYSRGFTRECWERPSMEGKVFADEACSQELVDEDLAKAVIYAKLPASPINSMIDFHESEHENDWSVDLNWAAVTTFTDAYDKHPRPCSAVFKVKQEDVSFARLVWNRNQMDGINGLYIVKIYVNDMEIYNRDQYRTGDFEGVFVQSLPGLNKGDEVKFEVTQFYYASVEEANPTFKASLEYTIGVCNHEYPAGGVICSKCGEIKEHDHNYANHECTLCGKVEDGYLLGYVGTDVDRKNIRWDLDNDTHVLTFTGTGTMEAFSLAHNAWRNEHKTTVTKVVIGEGITNIGDGSYPNGYFIEMSGLTEVVLPSTLRTIGSASFQDCINLTSITLPEGLETIKANGIRNCKKITSITLPSTLTSIGSTAFADCSGLRDMYIAGSEPITTSNDAFSYINRGNITLHVNGDLYDWAKATAPWSGFNIPRPYNIVYTDAEGVSHEVKFDTNAADNTWTLVDGCKRLVVLENIPMQQLTYTRNFSTAGQWQSLFVPFDIEITEAILDKCDIAKPYMVATDGATKGNFNEGDGADIVVLKKLNAGDVTKHGTAYYIRPKETGAFQLVLNDVTLYATDATSTLSCATTEDTYEFIGQYAAGKPASGTWYALAGGGFHLGDNASPNISAMRWYMTKTSKSGSPAPAPARIRIMTWGEDDATAIMDNQTTSQSDNAIYSLSGVRLSQPKKGMNIVNGKKVIIR